MTKCTEGYTVWLWMQTYIRKKKRGWWYDSAVTLLIIQKVFRAVMSQIPLWMLFTRPHLSENVCVWVYVCVCVRTNDVYACLCQTGEAEWKRETTAGSKALLNSQLLMLQEPENGITLSLSLFLHLKSLPFFFTFVLSPHLIQQYRCSVQWNIWLYS